MNYQELMQNAVIDWCKELDAHNGRWTKRAYELSALASKYCSLLKTKEKEGESE